MAIMGMSAHDICRLIMLFLGALMIFINFVLAAAALDKINSVKHMLPKVPIVPLASGGGAQLSAFIETTESP